MKQQCKNCIGCQCVKGLTKKLYICRLNSNIRRKKYAFVQGNAKPCEDYKQR